MVLYTNIDNFCYNPYMIKSTLNEIFAQRRQPNEISTAEIEAWLGVTRVTVNNWRNSGLITPTRYIRRHGNIYNLDKVRELAIERDYIENGNG